MPLVATSGPQGARQGQPPIAWSALQELSAQLPRMQQAVYFAGAKSVNALLVGDDRLEPQDAMDVFDLACKLLTTSVEVSETWVQLLATTNSKELSTSGKKR